MSVVNAWRYVVDCGRGLHSAPVVAYNTKGLLKQYASAYPLPPCRLESRVLLGSRLVPLPTFAGCIVRLKPSHTVPGGVLSPYGGGFPRAAP